MLEKSLVLAPSIVVDAGLNESVRVVAAGHIPHEAPSLEHGNAHEVLGVAGLARLANALESAAQGGEKVPAGRAGAMELPAPAATGLAHKEHQGWRANAPKQHIDARSLPSGFRHALLF